MPLRFYLLSVLFSIAAVGYAADSITPTISPAFFRATDQITVTYDVSGTPLASLTEAYLWVWIPGSNVNAKYNINPASSNPAVTNVIGPNGPKFVKSVVAGHVLFTITFVPANFFIGSLTNETQLGMLLKANDWPGGQTTDHVTNLWDGSFQIQLTSPTQVPVFVEISELISITAFTPVAADFELFINDVSVDLDFNITEYAYSHTITESAFVRLEATSVSNPSDVSAIEFELILSIPSPAVTKPPGIIPGINYDLNDPSKVTLCLWAPLKSSVYAIGDFCDWTLSANYLMNRDSEFFWIELTGLTPGEEYAFQYLVNEALWVSDPYADKILDPDDQYIPESTYPNLKPFPVEALRSNWYENRASVFQTAQTPYVWQVNDFEKPAKEKLVVYELLIRDFFDSDHRNYQTLIDTISYFKRLGINAIELMPIMEFNGNEGWGYNPTFMFAPDKYYGTKNKLKEFIDVCHQNGIAVILDIAMNHQDVPNTYASMYFDFDQFKPAANNPWFNVTPKHPFNVFFDMNHASSYTQAYLDTITHYWLREFKVDGYRFDLSKGFTQKNTGNDVGAWSAYDASRIFIMKRMADKIWSHTPDAYVILEHFAENSEEKELAEYRASEGKGMMLWGNINHAYNQNTMGYSSDSDIGWIYYKNRNWSTPHVVGYMESHDEERLMFKNLEFGNNAEFYDVKNESTALSRMRAAGLMFYTIPGPKMIWQFGELGFDYSINRCEDGSINSDCRLAIKPTFWEYQFENFHNRLYDHTADLLRLRREYDVFTSGDVAITGGSGLQKQLTLKNTPYTNAPSNTDEMNVQIAVNFDVEPKMVSVTFPHTGIWYDYYGYGKELNVTATPMSIELQPGGYKLFTDVLITNPVVVTGVYDEQKASVYIYPNPSQEFLQIEANEPVIEVKLYTPQGAMYYPTRSGSTWDIRFLESGFYVAEVRTTKGIYKIKVLKN